MVLMTVYNFVYLFFLLMVEKQAKTLPSANFAFVTKASLLIFIRKISISLAYLISLPFPQLEGQGILKSKFTP